MRKKLEDLATLIADYRLDEIAPPNADHVARWVFQFEPEEREVLLSELHHIWARFYVSKSKAEQFVGGCIENLELTEGGPARFWRDSSLLNIQSNGSSQKDLIQLFAKKLNENFELTLENRNGCENFVYLDDVLFTGSRIKTDLLSWLHKAPSNAKLHIILLAYHRYGQWRTETDLKDKAKQLEKTITFKFWRLFEWENRKSKRDDADVLWPTALPPEAAGYDQGQYPVELRKPGGASELFSSEPARHTVEQAFLKAGLRIRSFSANPKPILRPLGFGPFGVGFGSLFLSWRNCPNNAPLALWWGDPNAAPCHPFRKWYPLVPRKTYGDDPAF